MSSVCNILFEALFPGSSYSTRFSALSILGSVAEVFPVLEGKLQQCVGNIQLVSILLSFYRFLLLHSSHLDLIKAASKG